VGRSGTEGIEVKRKESKWDERKRSETNENEVGRSGTEGIQVKRKKSKWDERKMINLLLFAGIEPTGTMFQTINNLLLIQCLDFLGDVSVRECG